MKKVLLLLVPLLFLIFCPLFISTVHADLPPGPGGGPTGVPVGGGSPIGSGLVVLLSLGAAYGSRKIFQYRNHEKAD